MKSYQQVTLLGNVTADPEVKPVQTRDGEVQVGRFSIATSTGGYTKRDGTQVPEETMFHRITVWRGLAEYCKNYIHKGDSVFVTGELKYNEVEKDGKKDHYTDIVADVVSLCHSKNGIPNAQQMQQPMQQQAPYPQYAPQQPYPQYAPYPPQQFQQPYPPQQYPQQGFQNNDPNNAPY